MENKQIKGIKFILENCESVVFPYGCFKSFELIETEDESKQNYIHTFNCIIEDNGKSGYGTTWSDNKISPIQRLNQYNDITHIIIIHEDDSKKEYCISWDDYYNDNNINQTSELKDYKTLHISIKPYIQEYSISDLFKLTNGTKFKGSDGKIYTVSGDEDRYIESDNLRLHLEEKYFTMNFVRV